MSNYVPPQYNPAATVCTSCGSQQTETLDSIHGRRCVIHAPVYDRDWAMTLVDLGRASEAFTYLRQWIAYRARSA